MAGLVPFGIKVYKLTNVVLEVSMTEGGEKQLEALVRVAERYSEVSTRASQERWQLLDNSVYDSEVFEVVGGLIARQATLSGFLALSPVSWNAHVAPLLLRSMVEVHITLAWILLDMENRAKEFVAYGVGQEKLMLAHLRRMAEENPERAPNFQELISQKEAWLGVHKYEFLAEVNLGSWSGKNLRAMATESDCEQIYSLDYSGYSGSTHSMWQHLSIWNLEHCQNPLHKFHRVPMIQAAFLDEQFLLDSAMYLSRTLTLVDKQFELDPTGPMPAPWLMNELNALSNAESDNVDS
jgi:hypothetical protein